MFMFILLVASQALLFASGSEGPCEKIEKHSYWSITNPTCVMTATTVINSVGFLITTPRNDSVEGFLSIFNKKIEYLPENMAEKFPNLVFIQAQDCSIKAISKQNFKNLERLRFLALIQNSITKIESDTFGDLEALEELWLSSNKIKSLNGQAFSLLSKIKRVYLNRNECINEDFLTDERIAKMSEVVTSKCSFPEAPIVRTSSPALEPACTLTQLNQQENKMIKLMDDLNTERAARILAEAQTILLKEAFANQTAQMKDVYDKLEAQLKEIWQGKLELKMQEIYGLNENLQAKTFELDGKNEEIKRCKSKMEAINVNEGGW